MHTSNSAPPAPALPVIDISALTATSSGATEEAVAECTRRIGEACRGQGFFYVVQHGVPEQLERELEAVAREYFALPDCEKREISMERGGLAWRGSFLVGDELTSGVPDQKEGIYYGEEEDEEDEGDEDEGAGPPRPLRGKNLFHDSALGRRMRTVVLAYMAAMRRLGDVLMHALAASLGLRPEYFGEQFDHPTQLFRMFHYPPHDPKYGENSQAVGEHTDYGYLTILKQDYSGGLQVKSNDTWIDATPIPGSFVINLGDALEHNTGGLLRATPHRVAQRINASSSRFSFPYFYDPSFEAEMQSVSIHFGERDLKLAEVHRSESGAARWDAQDPSLFRGTYGNYLLKKVAKVFPLLAERHALV